MGPNEIKGFVSLNRQKQRFSLVLCETWAKPHLSKYWKIPPTGCAAFVVCIEDVLDVYHAPHDPQFPLICMAESNKQLVGEVHAPLAPAPGRGQIIDHEYVRNGVAEIFLEGEPLTGRTMSPSPNAAPSGTGPLSSKACSMSVTRRPPKSAW